MEERCECCGQRIPPQDLPPDVQFSPMKRKVWQAITSWPGMTGKEIMDWIYGHDPNGGPDSLNIIGVHVYQMNKQLRNYGLEIYAGQGHRDGYRLTKTEDGNETCI